jgi:effector-binding domain-containing protein
MKEQKTLSVRRLSYVIIILLIIFIGVPLMIKNIYGVEQAFKKTPVGKIEIKVIPESTVLVAEASGNYYGGRNDLFRRLFSYISENNVAMTVPVEARVENARMKFYVGTKDKIKALKDQGSIQVVTVPQRTVLSIGIRGAYTESSFIKAKAQLEQWLTDNKKYRQAGEAYAVFWDAPFMPWFLKRSEVHITVNKMK